jgi:hypothetical protein
MVRLPTVEHSFTDSILAVLSKHFGDSARELFAASPLLGYLNSKTKAANRGSKARGAFANHYALYVVIEDYIRKGFLDGPAKEPTPPTREHDFQIYLEGSGNCRLAQNYKITR